VKQFGKKIEEIDRKKATGSGKLESEGSCKIKTCAIKLSQCPVSQMF